MSTTTAMPIITAHIRQLGLARVPIIRRRQRSHALPAARHAALRPVAAAGFHHRRDAAALADVVAQAKLLGPVLGRAAADVPVGVGGGAELLSAEAARGALAQLGLGQEEAKKRAQGGERGGDEADAGFGGGPDGDVGGGPEEVGLVAEVFDVGDTDDGCC